ncbi:hypothetical protein ACJJTC_007101 [Scirpophaga incertulas]
MNPNEIRTSHPSSAQVETLVEFMERNPSLAKGFLRTQNARERGRRQWEEIAVRLNSLGGTIKTYKQWTKYWSDKKSAIKKKVAARSAARRRTGGGVEDVVELSELEERIVALCGGEGFSVGDSHLAIEPFPDPEEMASNPHNQLDDSRTVARRLFESSSSSAVGTSQMILQDYQVLKTAEYAHSYHTSMSPPPVTLSQTPSPVPMPTPATPSPSRRGSTQVILRRNAATSSRRHMSRADIRTTPVVSPSHRARSYTARASRGSDPISSRHTAPPPANAPPPSQRRTEFSTLTERFLRVEEHQVETQRTFAQILQTCVERNAERDRMLAEAMIAVGKGLDALAQAIKRD